MIGVQSKVYIVPISSHKVRTASKLSPQVFTDQLNVRLDHDRGDSEYTVMVEILTFGNFVILLSSGFLAFVDLCVDGHPLTGIVDVVVNGLRMPIRPHGCASDGHSTNDVMAVGVDELWSSIRPHQ